MVAGSLRFPGQRGYLALALPKLHVAPGRGNHPSSCGDGSNIIGADQGLEALDVAVAGEDVGAIVGHVMQPLDEAGAPSSQSPMEAEDRAVMGYKLMPLTLECLANRWPSRDADARFTFEQKTMRSLVLNRPRRGITEGAWEQSHRPPGCLCVASLGSSMAWRDRHGPGGLPQSTSTRPVSRN